MELILNFRPFPLLKNQFLQTTIGSYVNLCKNPPSCTQFIKLSDEDQIALEITSPPEWEKDGMIVLMIHGLCGSHKSPYMMRMANRLSKKQVKVVRLNLRGCGSGRGYAKKIYRSDSSGDVLHALKYVKEANPKSRIIVIGFSLGGNIALKLVGELGEKAKEFIQELIAISPPINLEKSAYLLGRPDNRFYEKHLIDLLVDDVRFLQEQFPDLPSINISKKIGILEFDEMYLAPLHGFSSVQEFYQASSSLSVIPNITIPCKILFSLDDPIVEHDQLDDIFLPSNIQVYKSTGGGHMGFLSRPNKITGVRWLDGLLLSWIFKKEIIS